MSGQQRASYVVTGGAGGVGGTIVARLALEGHVVCLDSAAEVAESAGPLYGWVNNAALFRDAGLADASASEVLDLVALDLASR